MANPLDDFGASEEDQLFTQRSDVDLDPFENDDAYREEDRDLGLPPRHEEMHAGIDGTMRREISDFNAYEQDAKTNPNKKHFAKLENGDYDEAFIARDSDRVQPEFKKIQAAEFDEEADASIGVDILKGIGSGVRDAGQGVINTLADLADVAFQLDNPNYYAELAKEYELPPGWEVNSGVGEFARTTTQFLTGFIPIMRGMKLLQNGKRLTKGQQALMKKTLGPMSAGAITDFTVWDIQDKRLVDLMEELGGNDAAKDAKGYLDAGLEDDQGFLDSLQDKLISALKYDKNDSNMMNRFKQGAEGALFGKLMDGVLGALKMTKRMKSANKGRGQLLRERDDILANKKATPQQVARAKEIDEVLTKEYGEEAAAGTAKDYEERLLGKSKKTQDLGPTKPTKLTSDVKRIIASAIKKKNSKEVPGIVATTLKKDWDSATHVDDWDELNGMLDELLADNKELMNLEGDDMLKQYAKESYETLALETKAGIINRMSQQNSIANHKLYAEGTLSQKEFASREAENMVKRSYFAEGGSNWGRQGLIRRKMLDKGKVDTAKVWAKANPDEKNFTRMGEGITQKYDVDADAAKFIGNLDPKGIYPEDMLERLSKTGWGDAGIEMYVNSILSTTSLGVNITSNIFMMFARTMDAFAAGATGKNATLTQALYQTYGLFNGFSDSLRMMTKPASQLAPLAAKKNPLVAGVRSYTDDKALFSRSKEFVNEFTPEASFTSKNIGFEEPVEGSLNTIQKAMNGAIDVTGKVLRGHPGGVRSMMATDELFKVMNYRANLHKTAAEAAEQAGYTMTDPRFGKFVSDFVDKAYAAPKIAKNTDPTIYQKASMTAMDMSHEMTFTSPFSKQGFWGKGESADKFYAAMREIPLVSMVMPFVRQPTNNLLYVARTTPGLNVLSGKLTRALQKGGPEAEIAEAQLNVASWMWSIFGLYAFNQSGKVIGPSNTSDIASSMGENKDFGIDPYTIQNKDGDFVNYRGAEPFAPRMALVSTLLQQWNSIMIENREKMNDEEFLDHAGGMVTLGGMTMMMQMKDMSSLQGLQRFLGLFDMENPGDAFGRYAAGLVAPLAGAIKYLNENYSEDDNPNDPMLDELQNPDNFRSNPEGFVEEWLHRYGANTVPDMNIFGDYKPKATPQEFGDFIGNNPATDFIPTNLRKTPGFKTKGQKEILRLKQALPNQAVLGRIPREIGSTKLSNVEKHNLMKFFKHAKVDGMNFEQRMVNIMQLDVYREGTDQYKALIMKKSWEGYMKLAKAALLADSTNYMKTNKVSKKVPGLLPYKRAKSLSREKARFDARERNNLVGPDGDVLDVDEYSNDYDDSIGNTEESLDTFFSN